MAKLSPAVAIESTLISLLVSRLLALTARTKGENIMVFEILTIRIKLTQPGGSTQERNTTAQRDDLEWLARNYSEVNNCKVEIYHNNELVAQYPEK